MKRNDFIWLGTLTASGIWLWILESQHAGLSATDTLPLLLAFPLFCKLGAPWSFSARPASVRFPWLALAAALACIFAGWILESGFLSALGWTMALGAWILPNHPAAHQRYLRRLLILPFLGFPWLVGAAGGPGWQFRLSAAWVTEKCFAASGLEVLRDGTFLSIQGQPLSVEAACAGLGSLQAMLLAGAVAAAMELGRSPLFWFCLPVLFIAAWIANTVRVILISALALSAGHETASGTLHGFIGWIVLMAVFSGCLAFFRFCGTPPRIIKHTRTTAP